MGRAVVTGAAGFLGGAASRALRVRGDDVVGLDAVRSPGCAVADVTVPGDWERELKDADLLVHAVGARADAEPGDARRLELAAVTAVLDAAARAGVGRVVVLGSADQHAPGRIGGPLDETEPAEPGDAPHRALAQAVEERALAAAGRGLAVTVVRAGDVYGPRSDPWTLRPVARLRVGRFALVDGGRGVLAPLHVDDLVDGVLAVAASPEAAGEVVHLAGGPVRAADFFGYYARMVGTRAPRSVPGPLARVLAGPPPGPIAAALTHAVPRALAARAPVRLPALTGTEVAAVTRDRPYSTAKAERLAGWRPRLALAEGMSRTEHWLRERGLLGVPEPSRRG